MLNYADYNGFCNLVSVYYKTNNHLNLKLLIFCRYTACFEVLLSKVQDFANFEISSMNIGFRHQVNQVTMEMLETKDERQGFQHLLRDL